MPQFRVVVNAVPVTSEPGWCGVRVQRSVSAPCAVAAAGEVIAAAGLADGMVGIWSARRSGLLGLGRRWQGRFGPDDDGLAGVREPRRPRPSAGSASMSLELPAA